MPKFRERGVAHLWGLRGLLAGRGELVEKRWCRTFSAKRI